VTGISKMPAVRFLVMPPAAVSYPSDGDVVLMTPSGRISVLYRKSSRHNTILF